MKEVGLRRVDIAVAAVAAVAGQQAAWLPLGAGVPHRQGPLLALAASYLVASAALLWRRRAPVTVVIVVTVALSAEYLMFGASDGLGSLLPPLFALYAAGRYGAVRRLWVALVVTAVGVAIHEWRDPLFVLDGRSLTSWSILVGGGVLGLVFNTHARDLHALARRTADLERERDERVRLAAEAERARITAELHDLVGHGLSLMVLQVVATQGALETGLMEGTREGLLRLEATARTTLVEMRRLVSMSGAEAALAPQRGLADLESLVREVRGNGLAVEFEVVGEPVDVAGGVGLAAYRVVQEALTNVIKHARPAAGARVVLGREGDTLSVEVLDSGQGPVGDLDGGRGVAGMRERVAVCGGTLRIGPRPGGGFGVQAFLPLGGPPP
jgi:signal transduction histidine kinase